MAEETLLDAQPDILQLKKHNLLEATEDKFQSLILE